MSHIGSWVKHPHYKTDKYTILVIEWIGINDEVFIEVELTSNKTRNVYNAYVLLEAEVPEMIEFLKNKLTEYEIT